MKVPKMEDHRLTLGHLCDGWEQDLYCSMAENLPALSTWVHVHVHEQKALTLNNGR